MVWIHTCSVFLFVIVTPVLFTIHRLFLFTDTSFFVWVGSSFITSNHQRKKTHEHPSQTP